MNFFDFFFVESESDICVMSVTSEIVSNRFSMLTLLLGDSNVGAADLGNASMRPSMLCARTGMFPGPFRMGF